MIKELRLNFIILLKKLVGVFLLLIESCSAQVTNKKVFAHYMVGFAFPSDQNYFDSQIKRAQTAGFDGFALNVGIDQWQPDR